MIKQLKEWFADFQPCREGDISKLPFAKKWVRYIEGICLGLFFWDPIQRLGGYLVAFDVHIIVMGTLIMMIIFMCLFRITDLIEYSIDKIKGNYRKRRTLTN